MELICIQGQTPGHIVATLAHQLHVRQVPMTIATHPAGGWHVRQQDGAYGPRCRAVATAVLLEAGEAFAGSELALAD